MRSSVQTRKRRSAMSRVKGVRPPSKHASAAHLLRVGNRVKTVRRYDVRKVVRDDD